MTPSGGSGQAPTRIPITGDEIRLDQFLKWAGVAATGGQAKALVQTGRVSVNEQQEFRRGRKLRPGDIVGVEGQDEKTYEVAKGGRDDS